MSAVRTTSSTLTLSRALPSRSPLLPPTAELSSSQLLRGEREVVIRHGEQVYRLRHTRNDKLILTK